MSATSRFSFGRCKHIKPSTSNDETNNDNGVGSVHASRWQRRRAARGPGNFSVWLYLTKEGWHVQLGAYRLFVLGRHGDSPHSVEINCEGFVQLKTTEPGPWSDRAKTTVLPIQILPDNKDGWNVNFFGQQWTVEKETISSGWLIYDKHHGIGEMLGTSESGFLISVWWKDLLIKE